jgi:hypothetical protein
MAAIQRERSVFITEAHQLAQDVEHTFGHLTDWQLNWKPRPDQWSVGQCLDHLIVTNTTYFSQFEQLTKGQKQATLWERLPLWPRVCGKLMHRVVAPETARPVKAPQIFQPSGSPVGPQIVSAFVTHQDELISWIKATGNLDRQRTILTSPVTSFITYSLQDTLRIILAHEKLHIQQAKQVQALLPVQQSA